MSNISLDQANLVAAAALSKGSALSLKPLTVVVVDAGGHLIALHRQDGASFGRVQIAHGKAAGALTLGLSSRALEEIAAQRPSFIGALGASAIHPFTPAAGGVIIVDEQSRPIGAVGISGDTSDNDEQCALAGLEAAGLRAQA